VAEREAAPGRIGVHRLVVGLAGDPGQERHFARRSGVPDGAGRPAVEALFERTHLAGADHLQQPGVDEHPDVVGDAPARSAEALGQFGDAHRTLEDEVEHGHPQRVAERLQAFGRVRADVGVERVVQNVRHFPNVPNLSDDRQRRRRPP
jgi:hypothetical protein